MKKSLSVRIVSNGVLMFASIASILPFILMISSSLTDEVELTRNGYGFIPSVFSLDAYQYLASNIAVITRAYFLTFFTTVVGVVVGLSITIMYAYVISRRDFSLSKPLAFLIFFTMLFNGGLVPTYVLYTNFWGIKNTILGQIIPTLLMNGFFVMITRAYFSNNVPMEILESARVDGAGEFRTFRSIVLPLSTPIVATIGLFIGVNYWNDWYNGMIYINKSELFTIQNLLNRLIQDMKMLATLGSSGSSVMGTMPTSSTRMAIAVIGVIPILIAYPFFQKYFVRGIAIGGVKG